MPLLLLALGLSFSAVAAPKPGLWKVAVVSTTGNFTGEFCYTQASFRRKSEQMPHPSCTEKVTEDTPKTFRLEMNCGERMQATGITTFVSDTEIREEQTMKMRSSTLVTKKTKTFISETCGEVKSRPSDP